MADINDRRDDSVGEEASALGQRAKGAVKDAVGAVTGDRSMEREGERENAMGRARQASNDVLDESDSVRGRTVGSTGMGTTSTGSGTMVTGLFRDRDSAERVYNSLSSRGYSKDDISLMMSDEARGKYFPGDQADTALGDKALEGAGVGSAIGGTIGAVLAGIAAIGTNVLLPGVGLIVAGPLLAGLAGAGAGGLTGGLVGALVGSGIPEDRAKEYESGIKEGGMVMGVNARNPEDAEYFEREFKNYRGENVYR